MARTLLACGLLAPIAVAQPVVTLEEQPGAAFQILDYSYTRYDLWLEAGKYDAVVDNRGDLATEIELRREDGKVVYRDSYEYEGVAYVPISRSANYTLSLQGEGRMILADHGFVYGNGLKPFIQSDLTLEGPWAYSLEMSPKGAVWWLCVQVDALTHAWLYDDELHLVANRSVETHELFEVEDAEWGAIVLQPSTEAPVSLTLTASADPIECTAESAIVSSPLATSDRTLPGPALWLVVMALGLVAARLSAGRTRR